MARSPAVRPLRLGDPRAHVLNFADSQTRVDPLLKSRTLAQRYRPLPIIQFILVLFGVAGFPVRSYVISPVWSA